MAPDVISQFFNEDDGYRSSFFVSGNSSMSSVSLPLEYSCESGWSTSWNLSSETGFLVQLGRKAWSTGKVDTNHWLYLPLPPVSMPQPHWDFFLGVLLGYMG